MPPNKWIEHVKSVRSSMPPGTPYKDVLKAASSSYHGRTPTTTAAAPAAAAEPAPLEGGAITPHSWPDRGRAILQTYGDNAIQTITLKRAPVEAAVQGLLNIVSLGAFKKATSEYDKLFHLAMIIDVKIDDAGHTKKLILEKNERVNLDDKIPNEKDAEFLPVDLLGKSMTLHQFVETTIDRIGKGAFFEYDSARKNCQRFVVDCLRSNGLLNPTLETWVVQDAEAIFRGMPKYMRPLARFLTDAGAVAAVALDATKEALGDVKDAAVGASKAIKKTTKKTVRKIRKTLGVGLDDSVPGSSQELNNEIIGEGLANRVCQTILVPKAAVGNIRAARALIKSLGLPSRGAVLEGRHYRFRQANPDEFDPKSYVTKRLSDDPRVLIVLASPLH